MKPSYIRNIEGSRIYYDVLSSKRSFYYTVEMLGLLAVSCDCPGHVKGRKHCKHMDTAEVAECEFLETQHKASEMPLTDEVKRREASLNGTRTFYFMR